MGANSSARQLCTLTHYLRIDAQQDEGSTLVNLQ